jgi:hypothetical protein
MAKPRPFRILCDLAWLAGAAGAAWVLPCTILVIEGVALVITVCLFTLERAVFRAAAARNSEPDN